MPDSLWQMRRWDKSASAAATGQNFVGDGGGEKSTINMSTFIPLVNSHQTT
jgi:hypothetical protein